MTQHTISEVRRADKLYDEIPIPEISERMDIPEPTLYSWQSKGWISTDKDHDRWVDEETVRRADQLIDILPPREVAGIIGVNVYTLYGWRQRGIISSEKDWRGSNTSKKVDPMLVVEAVHETEKSQKEVAREFNISDPTVSRYLKQYRNGEL